MKPFTIFVYISAIACITFAACNNNSTDGNTTAKTDSTGAAKIKDSIQPNALPFTVDFVEQQYTGNPPFPCLQATVSLLKDDQTLLAIGGRRQGLHTFESAPVNNFIPDSANNYIFVLDVKTGASWSFNVDSLDPALSAPLQSSNQQIYYDQPTDQVYIVGGYGWNAQKTNMLTFNTIIKFKAADLISAIKNKKPAAVIAKLLKFASDKLGRFAVTGGDLFKMNSTFYLVFGQNFTGQYRAFGGSDFSQKYTEEVRIFTLDTSNLQILSYGKVNSSDSDHPFHRRDGNTVPDINPVNGKQRITSYGGVFQPGIIAPYTYPVYIDGTSNPVIDRSGNQKFSQYECPVVSIFDSTTTNPTVYHTFFGGIGHYYYFQTDSQHFAYDSVTRGGRNDGFPFVEDITTFQHSADGSYNEYIHTKPIANNRLIGSTAKFLISPSAIVKGLTYSNGVIKLGMIPQGQRYFVGYLYGGIEAQNPLPLKPNSGTFVSNSVFAVYVTRQPTAAIPVSQAHESTKGYMSIRK
ncbi:MAG: hypothetical protein QM764_07305 [Chitinophagaceae bacterium]